MRVDMHMNQDKNLPFPRPSSPGTVNTNLPKSNRTAPSFSEHKIDLIYQSCNYHLEQETAVWGDRLPSQWHAGLHSPKIHTAFISILGTEKKKQIQAETPEAVFCNCKHCHYEARKTRFVGSLVTSPQLPGCFYFRNVYRIWKSFSLLN